MIAAHEPFVSVVNKLYAYVYEAFDTPHTFEQLRTTSSGHSLKPFVAYLSDEVHHPAIVSALLVAKWQFSEIEPDDRGVSETRAHVCEIAAWRFVSSLSKHDRVDYLLYELPRPETDAPNEGHMLDAENGQMDSNRQHEHTDNEQTPLLENDGVGQSRAGLPGAPTSHSTSRVGSWDEAIEEEDPTWSFVGLNALEIAAIANAKKFLSQEPVQRIVNGIWKGDIVFWQSLSVHAEKRPHTYNERSSDLYCRLRVPRYQKVFECLFFAMFLLLYYAVLVDRITFTITVSEVLLYIWIAGFALNEISELRDAGSLFYSRDFWSMWDIGIIGIGVAFLVARVVGLSKHSMKVIEVSFDILSLEALFLVPRICALLSLNPYIGTLIPCLKEMTKDLLKFLGIILVLYLGFLTTFTFLGRAHFTLSEMSWILIKVFFGSSYVGFDEMYKISPVLGPPLMLVFVCMSNILLITSLISLLTNSLTKVMDHARYDTETEMSLVLLLKSRGPKIEKSTFLGLTLHVGDARTSIFVLEASTSNRLTHFYPPLMLQNLLPLLLLRPLRLALSAQDLRRARIVLLKTTHIGFVALIWLFERFAKSDNGPPRYSRPRPQNAPKRKFGTSLNPSRPGLAPTAPSRLDGSQAAGRKSTAGMLHEQEPRQALANGGANRDGDGAPELRSLLARLSAQVDDLAATVAKQSQSETHNRNRNS
ncbi:MAG: hypothetical protein M1833_000908 [Piccolia ochrophora]|nr:MAG: hypothetical protein M1833_000908 [Piccolia ochrophora]